MKKLFRLVVFAMCISGLLSLFGCKKKPFMLDGPDMEYIPPWESFTLSRSDSSTKYSFWFSVAVGEENALVTGQCQDEKGESYIEETGIPITLETLRALQFLDLEQLPDEAQWPDDLERPMDMSKITLSVTLSDGTVVKKKASSELSMEIYNLLLPYLKNN